MLTVREVVIKCFEDVGIILDSSAENEDINLLEYGIDSLAIISVIVEIEEKLSINVPDDYLSLEGLTSFNGFLSMIESLVD